MSVLHGANMAWQLGGDAKLLLLLADDADGLVLLECRTKDNEPIDVRAILGRNWRVWQDLSSPARAGTVIALRKGGRIRRRWGVQTKRALVRVARRGPKLQDRYLRTLPVTGPDGPFELMGVHQPLHSTGQQGAAFDESRAVWRSTPGRKVAFMDGNTRPALAAQAITAPNHSGNGVLVWCWSAGWQDVDVSWRKRKGTDHEVGTFKKKFKTPAPSTGSRA